MPRPARALGPVLTDALFGLLLIAGQIAGMAAGPAMAQPVDDLERDDALVQGIAWRLQTANAAQCTRAGARTGHGTGIMLQDVATYADPALARRFYGLTGDIFVGALADAGPAARAGLAVNSTVAAIDGHPVGTMPPPPASSRFDRVNALQTLLDTPADPATVTLTTADGHTFALPAAPVCRFRVKVDDRRDYAETTRDEVHIGRRHLAYARGDTAVIAAMIAHEMAHAVLDHQSAIEAAAATPAATLATTRRTEREADRLSVWLLAQAGYPPEAAITFQRTVIARHAGPLTTDKTHGPWQTRARVIAEEIGVMDGAPDRDWAQRFRLEGE